MDPLGASRGEVARHGGGVVGVDVHPRAVPALQAHDAPIDQIYGGKEDHFASLLTMSTKLVRMRRPVAELFSGWNWTP